MDGKMLTQIIGERLEEMGVSVAEFCAEIGITQSAYSQWKRMGRMPKADRMEQIEKYLGINFSDYEKSDPREALRDDLRILLRSASDLPPSSVYQLIAQIEREKEQSSVISD